MSEHGCSFPRLIRLTHSSDFARVFSKASRSTDRYFTVLFRENKQNTSRMGMAVSKKRLKFAVSRNRMKRIIRESFRQQTILDSGVDIVILVKNGIDKADNKTLFDSLNRHWQKVEKSCRNF